MLGTIRPFFQEFEQTTTKENDDRIGQEKGKNPFEDGVDRFGSFRIGRVAHNHGLVVVQFHFAFDYGERLGHGEADGEQPEENNKNEYDSFATRVVRVDCLVSYACVTFDGECRDSKNVNLFY